MENKIDKMLEEDNRLSDEFWDKDWNVDVKTYNKLFNEATDCMNRKDKIIAYLLPYYLKSNE